MGVTKVGLAGKLKRLREDVDLNQEVVARMLEIPRSAMSAIESGEREVSALELQELCKLYRISPDKILGWREKESAGE
jgi:transcriptional regulator with XRE-family HTH domain